MAEVIVTFKVMPKTVEVDLNKLEEKINFLIEPEKISREPIAFGLVALNVTKLIPDAGGELEKIENKLKSIPEVGEIEVTEITRSL
jgi:elongation factor 1-beta